MEGKHRWINDNIKIDFPVTTLLQNTMDEAEEADLNGSMEYWAIADAIDMVCKAYVTGGHMTMEQWNRVVDRYPS